MLRAAYSEAAPWSAAELHIVRWAYPCRTRVTGSPGSPLLHADMALGNIASSTLQQKVSRTCCAASLLLLKMAVPASKPWQQYGPMDVESALGYAVTQKGIRSEFTTQYTSARSVLQNQTVLRANYSFPPLSVPLRFLAGGRSAVR